MTRIHNYLTVDIYYYEKDMTEERRQQLIKPWTANEFTIDFTRSDRGKFHVQCTKVLNDNTNQDAFLYDISDAYSIAFGTKGTANINPITFTLSAG